MKERQILISEVLILMATVVLIGFINLSLFSSTSPAIPTGYLVAEGTVGNNSFSVQADNHESWYNIAIILCVALLILAMAYFIYKQAKRI